MKPQILTLKNFGPFLDEKVDFECFQEQGLFLISGKTGAGKTTIFDGMTFALFGKTSGQLRSGKEMRSSFATAQEATEVSFRFEHQGHFYQVTRSPEQELAKKRGPGFTRQAPKVQLEIFDASGKLVAHYGRKKEVDDRIEELLNVNAEQFFQLILLPQGEFRQFLIAPSDEKEKLLRHLFGTQLYQRLNEWLQNKRKELESELQRQLDHLEQLKQQFQLEEERPRLSQQETLDFWQSELVRQQNAIRQEELAVESLKNQEKMAEQSFYQGKEKNEHIAEYDQLLEKQRKLAEEEGEFTQLEQKIRQLSWLNEHKELLQQQAELQQEEKLIQQRLVQLCDQQKENQKEQESLVQQGSQYEEWQQQAEKNQYELKQIIEKLPLAEESKRMEEQLQLLLTEIKQDQKVYDKRQERLEKNKDRLLKVEETVSLQSELQEQKFQLYQSRQKVEDYLHKQEEYQLLTRQQQETEKEKQELERQLQQQQQNVHRCQSDFEAARSENAKMQIARLSLYLKEGEPCPVCGSTQHHRQHLAKKAYSSTEIQQNETILAQTEKAYQQIQLDHQQTLTLLTTCEEKRTTLADKANKAAQVKQLAAKICEQELNIRLQQTDPQLYLKDQQKALAQKEEGIEQAEKQQKELKQENETLAKQQTQQTRQTEEQKDQKYRLQAQSTALKEQLGELDAKAMRQKQQQLEDDNQKLQQQLQDYRQQQEKCREQAAVLKERSIQQKKQQQLTQEKLLRLQDKLEAAIAQSGFDFNSGQLQTLLTELATLTDLREKNAAYQKEKAYVSQRLKELVAFGDSPKADLSSLATALQQAEKKTSLAQQKQVQLTERQRLNQQTYTDFERSYAANKEKVEELSQLNQLVDTMNGNNEKKLSIERYVLQSFLAEILETANVRLYKLSQGRYQFQLSDHMGSYKKSTGLEIDVYDDHAGVSRRAHTLSGGESFIAALALALSLGDVIQNHSGGVVIEALFIDEGFGSLDEEALEMAIEALEIVEDEGRMIGIISHVNELKNRIAQQLLVKTDGKGQSCIQTRLIQ